VGVEKAWRWLGDLYSKRGCSRGPVVLVHGERKRDLLEVRREVTECIAGSSKRKLTGVIVGSVLLDLISLSTVIIFFSDWRRRASFIN
jgi:hypothetical protein